MPISSAKINPLSPLPTVVETADGSLSLVHPEHGECYHSRSGALTEARSLYIEMSGFLPRLAATAKAVIEVLDVGLGLGYNALASIDAWAAALSASPLC